MRFPRIHAAPRAILAITVLGFATACVSQKQYDDAVATAKSYEKDRKSVV